MLWNNWIDSLMEKLDEQFVQKNKQNFFLDQSGAKLGCKVDDIIGFKNLVEKWMDNLLMKLGDNLIEHLFGNFGELWTTN